MGGVDDLHVEGDDLAVTVFTAQEMFQLLEEWLLCTLPLAKRARSPASAFGTPQAKLEMATAGFSIGFPNRSSMIEASTASPRPLGPFGEEGSYRLV
jgi:hypothetical protein